MPQDSPMTAVPALTVMRGVVEAESAPDDLFRGGILERFRSFVARHDTHA